MAFIWGRRTIGSPLRYKIPLASVSLDASAMKFDCVDGKADGSVPLRRKVWRSEASWVSIAHQTECPSGAGAGAVTGWIFEPGRLREITKELGYYASVKQSITNSEL
jgi:hypothetical protein